MSVQRAARRHLVGAAALGTILFCLFPSLAITAARKGDDGALHTVVISGTAFRPPTLTVNVGDRIVWKNDDPFAHTVTSRDGKFDSKDIAAGGPWTYRAAQTGTFPYICTLHRTMKGTLIVR